MEHVFIFSFLQAAIVTWLVISAGEHGRANNQHIEN
jgi:hypothetical protein